MLNDNLYRLTATRVAALLALSLPATALGQIAPSLDPSLPFFFEDLGDLECRLPDPHRFIYILDHGLRVEWDPGAVPEPTAGFEGYLLHAVACSDSWFATPPQDFTNGLEVWLGDGRCLCETDVECNSYCDEQTWLRLQMAAHDCNQNQAVNCQDPTGDTAKDNGLTEFQAGTCADPALVPMQFTVDYRTVGITEAGSTQARLQLRLMLKEHADPSVDEGTLPDVLHELFWSTEATPPTPPVYEPVRLEYDEPFGQVSVATRCLHPGSWYVQVTLEGWTDPLNCHPNASAIGESENYQLDVPLNPAPSAVTLTPIDELICLE